MAWIKFSDDIPEHFKTLEFMEYYGCSLNEAIGMLARFLWWCTKYAMDGDLSKHSPERIGSSVGLKGKEAEKFYKILVKCQRIDRKPYRRVHGWWEHQKQYLKAYFKDQPDKWQRIEKLYSGFTPDLLQSKPRVSSSFTLTQIDRDVERKKDRKKETLENIVNKARPTTPLEPASSASNGSKKSEPENGEAPVSKAEVQEFLKTLVKQRPDPF